MLRRLLTAIFVVVLAAAVFVGLRYRSWLAETERNLDAGSSVAQTTLGPIEYAHYGSSGPVVLLVHGTPGGYDQVQTLGERAAELGYRALAVSRPGYLRTPIETGRTPAEQADAYAGLLDALDIERIAIVGFSGGGPSAIEFAVRHPDRCWALVDLMGVSRARLPDETFPGDEISPLTESLLGSNFGGWLLGAMIRRDPASIVTSLIAEEPIRRRILDDPEKLAGLADLAESTLRLPARRRDGTRNDVEQFDALEPAALERIAAPTLVLHGTLDRNVPIAMGELVAERVPGAQIVRFEGADHFMVISHVDEVFGSMFDFLGAIAPGR